MVNMCTCASDSFCEAVGGCHVIFCLPLLSVPPLDCSELGPGPALGPAKTEKHLSDGPGGGRSAHTEFETHYSCTRLNTYDNLGGAMSAW